VPRSALPLLIPLALWACDDARSAAAPAPPAPPPVTAPEPPKAEPETVLASHTKPAKTEVCPPEMALVEGRFCIDKWEASTVGADGKAHSPYQPVTFDKVQAESRPGVVPQAYISMEEADQACTRAGKRLCTTQQWVDACMGSKSPKRSYPYGNVEKPDACNTQQGGAHPLMALHEGRRPTDSVQMNDARINQLASTVAPTGAFEACATPDGVMDMSGNLLEWTRGARPLLMGGYYLDATENGKGCAYVTMRHDEKYHDFSTGFRCCLEPSAEALRAREAEAPPPEVKPTGGDPIGYRSFSDPGAKLPPMPTPPPYEPADAVCPVDMALVDGERCNAPEENCLKWLEVPGQEPERSCAEFAPSVCKGGKRHMRYCIDQYEYTPKGWSLPLVNVSWGEAQNICNAEDKRICLEDEWEFACEGPEALPYPYGNVRDGEACNHDRPDLFDKRGKLNDQRVAAESLSKCKSPFGVYNLVGNVDEWTTRVNKEPPWRSILRGGWWLTGRNRCRAATESHNEIYAGPQTSFRCCKAARR
jgi:sulfatase modifying factor 1